MRSLYALQSSRTLRASDTSYASDTRRSLQPLIARGTNTPRRTLDTCRALRARDARDARDTR